MKGGSILKKNINYISIDEQFRSWLLDKLSNEPPKSSCIDEIKASLIDLNNGTLSGILLADLINQAVTIPIEEQVERICNGDLCIIPRNRKVFVHSNEISLTPKEYDILYFLCKNQGEIFTKEQIYKAVWDNEYLLDDSNIMAFIRKLRKKIEPNPDAPIYILTIWGIGYKFNDDL